MVLIYDVFQRFQTVQRGLLLFQKHTAVSRTKSRKK